jgi:hypothetical protein
MVVKTGKGKRKWKSLTLKVEHLRLEVEEREEEIDEITRTFMEELSAAAEEDPEKGKEGEAGSSVPNAQVIDASMDPQGGEAPEEHATRGDPDVPEEIKALWKQIAKVAHPDKTGGDEEKTNLYKRAAAAIAAGNIDEVVAVAAELGFDLPEASEASVARLEKVAVDLEGRLKNIENSVIWQWAAAPKNKRAAIMALYMKSKGLRPKKKV